MKVLPTTGGDRDKIRQALEGLRTVGAAGIYTMSPTDRNGTKSGMPMLVVEGARSSSSAADDSG